MTQTALTKNDLKQIEITQVQVFRLAAQPDCTGEWSTDLDIQFKLSESCTFEVLGQTYTIDRIRMFDQYEEVALSYADENKSYCCFPVSKIFVDKVRRRVIEEQRPDGKLDGWNFNQELLDILQDESHVTSCW